MKPYMDYLTYIDTLMQQGYSEEFACRMADMEFNPNYSANDYEGHGEI